jgi:hypothetical protein
LKVERLWSVEATPHFFAKTAGMLRFGKRSNRVPWPLSWLSAGSDLQGMAIVGVLYLAAHQIFFNSRIAAMGVQFDCVLVVVPDQGHGPGSDGVAELARTPRQRYCFVVEFLG